MGNCSSKKIISGAEDVIDIAEKFEEFKNLLKTLMKKNEAREKEIEEKFEEFIESLKNFNSESYSDSEFEEKIKKIQYSN